MRAQILGTLLMWSLVASQQVISAAGLRPGSHRAFRFFESLPGTVESALESLRPTAIHPDEKRRVLLTLPAEGELRPATDEVAKLASLQQVLMYHKRADVFEIKVIDVPRAAIALHARAVLLLSRPALRLLSAAELQATIAHEVGHEYFWTEYERIRDGGHARARQELELRCDAIAVLTLMQLDLDPALVISAVRKVTRFNELLGANANVEQYPTTGERAQFVRAIIEARGRPGGASRR